jgi:hypothetical protein
MAKRAAAGILWSYVTMSLWNGVALASEWPAAMGVVLGALVCGMVWWDPVRVFSSSPALPRRAPRPPAMRALDPQA